METAIRNPQSAESLISQYGQNASDSLSPLTILTDKDILSRPISTDYYMDRVKVAFDAFLDVLPADFIPAILPPSYLQTCNVDFQPTVGRILYHDLANAMNAVLAYNPYGDFRENERDMVKPNGARENTLMAGLLVESFQQFGQTFHTMREAASLRPDADILVSHFDLFSEEMINLTQRFSVGNETLSRLPAALQPWSENQEMQPSFHQGLAKRLTHNN